MRKSQRLHCKVILVLFVATSMFWLPQTQASGWTSDFGGSFKSIFAQRQLRQQGLYDKSSMTAAEQRLRLRGSFGRRQFRFEFANELGIFSESLNVFGAMVFGLGEFQFIAFL